MRIEPITSRTGANLCLTMFFPPGMLKCDCLFTTWSCAAGGQQLRPYTIRASILLHSLEENILRTFPQHESPHFPQLLAPVDDGEEVVASQLPNFAGEASAAVGKQDL